eukprot:gb/GECH01009801.1/.p1 GENE.gb/GECH01009801.1/~~gb/GECH01009801.1/.p1  ORF type:complete len:706 (+),score=157.41 gb/GECH01009801.1/:1-2118(+)
MNYNTNSRNNSSSQQTIPRTQKKTNNHYDVEIISAEPPNRTETHTENTRRANVTTIQQARDIMKRSFGPNALSVLISTPNKKIVSTSDGATILAHLDISHPVCKLLQNGCFSMDHFYGDGTTSTFLLAAALIERGYFSPIKENQMINLNLGIQHGLDIALDILSSKRCIALEFDNQSFQVNELERIINCALGSKVSLHTEFIVKLLAEAISMLYDNNRTITSDTSGSDNDDVNTDNKSPSSISLPYSSTVQNNDNNSTTNSQSNSSDNEFYKLLHELEMEYEESIDDVLERDFNSDQFVFDAGDIKFSAITGSTVTDSFAVNGYLLQQIPISTIKETRHASIALLSCGVERERIKTKKYNILDTPDRVRQFVADEEKVFHSQADFIHQCNVSVLICGGSIHPVALERFNELGIVCMEKIDNYSLETLSKVVNAPIIHNVSALKNDKIGLAEDIQLQEFSNRKFTVVKCEIHTNSQQGSKSFKSTSFTLVNRPISVIIRGPTMEQCEEYIRYARDALKTVEVITSKGSKVVCGGGAAELECAYQLNQYIHQHHSELNPVKRKGIQILADSLQDMVGILVENAGLEPGLEVARLDQAHRDGMNYAGIHANASIIHESNIYSFIDSSLLGAAKLNHTDIPSVTNDMMESGVFDAFETKKAVFSTAVDLSGTILSLNENIANKNYVFQQKAKQNRNEKEKQSNQDFAYF